MSDNNNSGPLDSISRVRGDLAMRVSHRDRSIGLSLYESNHTNRWTLLPYEELEIEWERVGASCREIVALLNRANRRVGPTAEVLSGLRKTGRVLFELLIPPRAREMLNSALSRNLILYLYEQLVQIPWELLFDGEEFLCRRFAMGRIVSTRHAPPSLSTRTLKAPLELLVLADPCGDLGGAYREGIALRNFLDAQKEIFHVDFKSHPVETSFVRKNLRDYDIVHYAGHADYLTGRPSESGWLLNDGRLKASEISAMGGGQSLPALVFCNACQTAQTEEWANREEYEQRIFGLANAYLLAGVRHYIGTFWEILDEQGSSLVEGFYDALARGESIGEALRRMREDLIRAYGEEVLIWAGYVLYGDPTCRLPLVGTQTTASLSRFKTVAPKPVLEDQAANVLSGKRRRSLTYPQMVSGGLLLALILVGYSLFYPKAVPKLEISPAPVAYVPLPAVKKKERMQVPLPIPVKEVESALRLDKTTETKIRKEKLPATEQPAKIPTHNLPYEMTPPASVPEPNAILPMIAEAPKYEIGDSWTLRLFDGQTATRRIRSIENGLYVIECDSNRWQYLDRDFVLRKEVMSGGKERYPLLLNQRLLHFPLSPGKNWGFKIRTSKSEKYGNFVYYWRVFRYKVTAYETIKTRAGTFGAFKIEERSNEIVCDNSCGDVLDSFVVRELWYAPETRFIVKIAHISGEPWQGEEPDYELISLELN